MGPEAKKSKNEKLGLEGPTGLRRVADVQRLCGQCSALGARGGRNRLATLGRLDGFDRLGGLRMDKNILDRINRIRRIVD